MYLGHPKFGNCAIVFELWQHNALQCNIMRCISPSNHSFSRQEPSWVWNLAALAKSTSAKIPPCRGSSSPPTAAPVRSAALQSNTLTSWPSRVKVSTTSSGIWMQCRGATSSWGPWTRKGRVTGRATCYLQEEWKPGWLDRRCCSTPGCRACEQGGASGAGDKQSVQSKDDWCRVTMLNTPVEEILLVSKILLSGSVKTEWGHWSYRSYERGLLSFLLCTFTLENKILWLSMYFQCKY